MRARHHASFGVGFAIALVAFVPSCGDPVETDAIAALGPEAPGVRPGPRHRPGQPCLICHNGNESPDLAIGGTVYANIGDPTPARDTSVVLTDAKGSVMQTTTNDVGNFYIEARRWAPVYPLRVVLRRGGKESPMLSRLGRTGSCADCHVGSGNRSRMPAVYFREAP